ncbi:hypothetical protein [Fredinandcohnia quinoae]|uniref:Uncharacterized protein n=1 Tax=Fredinandcohnia quinoae TaxID=2918902 RepID=A0AAW5DUJ3_9BACI|nr:hypothetical protein [Fredinandcohnia sp. SECRCQ15]MCH1624301.1 hypothetical protein [Fredinandcohnia sp. SECRCQ15]
MAFRIYKKQTNKPKIWKTIIVIWVGLFSFSFNWTVFDEMIKIAILPLGVWILMMILKRREGRWEKYRTYAWLGFLGNFIFLISTLVSIPLHHLLYPVDKPTTYLSKIENDATVIHIHPSATNITLNKKSLLEQIPTMKETEIFSDVWYRKTYMSEDPTKRKERFPYQLIGTEAKWGSGLKTLIFLEEDGKGILISTAKKQIYFRSDASFFGGGK